MDEENTGKLASSDLLDKEKARLRKIGLIVLLLGFTSAGLVYWIGTRSLNSNLDEYEQSRQRSEARQMEMLYGKSGDLTADFFNVIKRPGPQAIAIVIVTALIAGACFYLGRPLDETDEPG